MAQEYFINSQTLEDTIRDLLPSQGGAGAGFDLSASTQIIPVINVTESAEGSNLREDLQNSLSYNSVTTFNVVNAVTTIINNTGFYRVFGVTNYMVGTPALIASLSLSDGVGTKTIWQIETPTTTSTVINQSMSFDFIVYITAGDSFVAYTSATAINLIGCTRQIATIDGELVAPN